MVAVVTGSTKGIGKAIVDEFSSQVQTFFLCSRSESDLILQREEINFKYPNISVHIFKSDVSILNEVQLFADFISSHTSKIDLLVNNAGVFLSGSMMTENEGQLEKMIQTNLYSAYYLTKYLFNLLKISKSAHIFNICSIASIKPFENGGSYAISKFALYGFSKSLREELKPLGIKVTSVLPGATWSNSWAGIDLPHHRLMEAQDIAKSILSAFNLGPSTLVEEIILRPILGDL